MGIQPFALIDQDCRLDPARVRAWAEAATIAAQRDFADARWGYGRGAAVTVRASVAAALPGERLIVLLAHPDEPGALGYHDPSRVTKVFPLLDSLDNAPCTITHELFEWLGDEDCATIVIGPDGRLRLREAADPVEATELGYDVTVSSGAKVRVSDFVGIDYFSGPAADGSAPHYDFCGHVREPGQILPGGYQTFYDPRAGYTQQTNGRKRAYREALDALAAHQRHPTRAMMARATLPRVVDRAGCFVEGCW